MKRFKKWMVSLLALLLVLAGAAYVWRKPLAMAVAQRMATRHLSADRQATLPDGLHVGICGAGSPFPDERRSGPCTVVVAGSRLLVFDAGNGSVRNLGKMDFLPGKIEAIFLTHFHSDHIDGLGELLLQRWVAGSNTAPVPVYGPPGVEQVLMGLRMAYQLDQHYRVAHHGDATVPASGFGGQAMPFALGTEGRVVVLKDKDLEVVAFAVDHSPVHPSVGYRIQYKDRTVVLSGDTKPSAAVQREAKGADVLVHEALSVPMVNLLAGSAGEAHRPTLKKIFGDIVDYHSTPEQAAQTAAAAQVGFLLLNHIVPTLPPLPGLEEVFLGDSAKHFNGPIHIARDGDLISLPAGAKGKASIQLSSQ